MIMCSRYSFTSLPCRQRLPRAQDSSHAAAQQDSPRPQSLCDGQRVSHEVQQEGRRVNQRQGYGAEASDEAGKIVETAGVKTGQKKSAAE